MSFEDLKHWIQDRVGGKPAPAVAVLRLEGVIGGRGVRGLTLQRVAQTIERAFKLRNLKAVALAVNSPGGAPVQSALLYRRIRQLAAEKKVPVFAFAEDVAASGGYWLLLAGDEIYADAASIVGSIGVVTSSFGFAEVLKRLGVERRLHTSGRDKSLLDPFLAEDPREVGRLERLQRDLHATFKSEVETRRGAKLSRTVELFEGEIFSGRRAVELGLVDGLGELRGVMRERFGESVRLRTLESARASLVAAAGRHARLARRARRSRRRAHRGHGGAPHLESVRALSPPRLDPGGPGPLNRSMFGVGLFKLLFLAGAVAGVWYLFKMLAGPSAPPADPEPQVRGRNNAAGTRAVEADDMVACKVCGTFVAATGARSCGRADCPSRG